MYDADEVSETELPKVHGSDKVIIEQNDVEEAHVIDDENIIVNEETGEVDMNVL